jgi:hypothetical protein
MRGSVRPPQPPTAQRRPDRSELRAYLGRDENGRERHASRVFTGTQREAQSALAEFLKDVARGRQSESAVARASTSRQKPVVSSSEPQNVPGRL